MSSVVSVKTNASGQSHYSQRSDLKSAVSGYSRTNSAYSQKRKELLAQEQKKEMEDLVQKQLAEQERHKRIMMENKRRMKMQQEQLKKDLETKKQQEEEYLKKMKEDKKSAYMKYLKENSKEILQNFKKKEGNAIPPLDNNKNPKKNIPIPTGYSKQKPTSADPYSQKLHKLRQAGHISSANNATRAGNVNNNPNAKVDYEKNFELIGVNEDFNLDALDLDFDRSTNNFKRIIDQYHKDMEQLKQNEQNLSNNEEKKTTIPMEQFYEKHLQQNAPLQSSKLLESLDLSSSLTNWNPGKSSKKTVEATWRVQDQETGKINNKDDYLSSYKNKNYEETKENKQVGKEKNAFDEDEVEEKIEALEEDSFEKDFKAKDKGHEKQREHKKLLRISEVSEKQRKQDWHLNYIDNQSQCSSKPPKSQTSVTPKGSILESKKITRNNKDPKSLDTIPNEEKKQENNNKQVIHHQQNKSENKGSTKRAEEKKIIEDFNFDNLGQNQGFLQETGLHFKWADEVKDDDFYKDLNRQVPSREINREKKIIPSNETPKTNYGKPPPVFDSARQVNALEADQDTQEYVKLPPEKKISAFEVKKPVQSQDKKEVKRDKSIDAPVSKSKPTSVVGSNVGKKDAKEKENQGTKKPGLRSRLEGHVKASQQVGQKGKDFLRKGGRRANSPTTTCTRDTDLDVEEFLKDDFQMLNQEEENLQKEILDIHRNEIGKVKQVVQKHNINTAYHNSYQLAQKTGENIAPPEQNNSNVPNEDALEESLERLDILLAKQRNSNNTLSQVPTSQNPSQKNIPPQPIANYPKETSLYQQVMQGPPQNQVQQTGHPPFNQAPYNPNYPNQISGNNYYGSNNDKNAPSPQNLPTGPNPYINNQVYPGSGYINDPYYANQQALYGNVNLNEPVYSPEFATKNLQGPNNPHYMPPNANVHNYYLPQQQVMPNQYPPYGNYSNPHIGGPYNPEGEMGYQKNMNNNPQNYQIINNENINNQNQGQYVQMKQPLTNEGQKEQIEKLKTFSFGNKGIQSELKEVPEMGESLEEFEQFEKAVFSDQRSAVSSKTYASSKNKLDEKTEEKSGGYGDKKYQQKGKAAQKPPLGNKEVKITEDPSEAGEGKIKVVTNADLKHLLLSE